MSVCQAISFLFLFVKIFPFFFCLSNSLLSSDCLFSFCFFNVNTSYMCSFILLVRQFIYINNVSTIIICELRCLFFHLKPFKLAKSSDLRAGQSCSSNNHGNLVGWAIFQAGQSCRLDNLFTGKNLASGVRIAKLSRTCSYVSLRINPLGLI